jgi:hypothetical protein
LPSVRGKSLASPSKIQSKSGLYTFALLRSWQPKRRNFRPAKVLTYVNRSAPEQRMIRELTVTLWRRIMAAIEPAGEKIVRHLQDAVERLHEDIRRVELWASALGSFSRPIPDYDVGDSKFLLLPKRPRPSEAARRAVGRERGRSPVNGGNGRGNGQPNGHPSTRKNGTA